MTLDEIFRFLPLLDNYKNMTNINSGVLDLVKSNTQLSEGQVIDILWDYIKKSDEQIIELKNLNGKLKIENEDSKL